MFLLQKDAELNKIFNIYQKIKMNAKIKIKYATLQSQHKSQTYNVSY